MTTSPDFFRRGRGKLIGPSGLGPAVAMRTGLEMSFLAEAPGDLFSSLFFLSLIQDRNHFLYTCICYLKLTPCGTHSSREAGGSPKSVLGPKFSVLSSKSIKQSEELRSSHLLDVAVVALRTHRPLMLSIA